MTQNKTKKIDVDGFKSIGTNDKTKRQVSQQEQSQPPDAAFIVRRTKSNKTIDKWNHNRQHHRHKEHRIHGNPEQKNTINYKY